MIKKSSGSIILALIAFLFHQPHVFSQDENKTLLWEISGKNLKKPSYLYGTIHIRDKRVFNYDTAVAGAFSRSDVYVMEMVMDKLDPQKQKDAVLMKDSTLDQLMTKQEYKRLDSVLKKRTKMSLMMYNKMKPFFLMSAMQGASLNKDLPEALDMHFLSRAREAGKEVLGLEKLEDQLYAVDNITLRDQVKMLQASLEMDSTQTRKEYEKLISVYLKGDLAGMLKLTADSTLPKSFEKVFIHNRNIKMANGSEKIFKKKSAFIAVGAAHLGGEKGVIELLRKKGYTVKPVKTKFKD
ncbi:MAG: TraB/GumN family protein [Bacteroidota bacterium]